MLDGSAAGPLLDDLSEEELLAGGAAWPCTWILLQPSTKGPRHQSPTQPIAVPLRIDNVRATFSILSAYFDVERAFELMFKFNDAWHMIPTLPWC